jgi:tetratricopeptide (TPR) repeat protein
MTDQASDTRPDFFVSYTGADQGWAEWIAYTLEAKGLKCVIQAWDFRPGANFVLEMQKATSQAERTIAVLSPAYLRKPFPASEWSVAFCNDPEGMRRKLVPVRVEECHPEGLLKARVYIDLVGLDETAAATALLNGVAPGRAKPATSPAFPGAKDKGTAAPAPTFPGHRSSAPPVCEPLAFGGAMPARNANFIGRAALLDAVHASLIAAEESPTALTQAAVHGLGGVGKTSLAREYVHRFGPKHAGVWWLAAETREELITGLAALAAQLDPALAEGELEKMARAALAHVEQSNPPFLLIYDNVPTPSILEGLVPQRGARVLLTTRWSDWGGQAREILVETLEEDEAVEFLQLRAGRRDKAGARRLARDLGCLPLALDHAGAYVRRAVMSFSAYAKRVEELIAKAPKDANYPASVAATFDLAITAAAQECAAAERLLSCLAFLAPERIPLDLVDETVLPENERGEALMALTAVSLVRPDPASVEDEPPSVSVHRLVQAVMRARLATKDVVDVMPETVVSRLAAAFPDGAYADVRSWPACERLLPHVLALREKVRRQSYAFSAFPTLLDRVAAFLHGRGQLREAEPLYREAVETGERVLGREHPDVLIWRNNLATLLRDTGRHAEAEPLYREVVETGEQVLGREHPHVLGRRNNLATLLQDTGRHAEAEPLYREVVETGERVLGREHPDVLMWRNNLVTLVRDTGRQAEAELLLREVVETGERVLGREHPDVLIWRNNLATLLRDTGRHAEAEPLHREVVETGERVLGREHPDVLVWRANLARLLRDTGRQAEAELLLREVVETGERVLGHEHPYVLIWRSNLTRLQQDIGRPG